MAARRFLPIVSFAVLALIVTACLEPRPDPVPHAFGVPAEFNGGELVIGDFDADRLGLDQRQFDAASTRVDFDTGMRARIQDFPDWFCYSEPIFLLSADGGEHLLSGPGLCHTGRLASFREAELVPLSDAPVSEERWGPGLLATVEPGTEIAWADEVADEVVAISGVLGLGEVDTERDWLDPRFEQVERSVSWMTMEGALSAWIQPGVSRCEQLLDLREALVAAGYGASDLWCTPNQAVENTYALFGLTPSGVPFTLFAGDVRSGRHDFELMIAIDDEGDYIVFPGGCRGGC